MNQIEVKLIKFLGNSSFQKYLDIFPRGEQLPSFIATVKGLKAATDLWVRYQKWESFCKLVRYFGLFYYVDAYFVQDIETLNNLPKELFTTTKAVFGKHFERDTEAHVFIAKSQKSLVKITGAGWYPLVVNKKVIEKHLADHYSFGKALGYPSCCLNFFQKYNNWYFYNNYYETYRNTINTPTYLSNGFLRLIAFSLIPHIPCSFHCLESIDYAQKLRLLIKEESQEYLCEIERHLQTPILCLSELKIYRFEGRLLSKNTVLYHSVETIFPTLRNDSIYQMLIQGDICIIEGNIVRVYQDAYPVGVYFARGDRHAVEAPFLINFN